MDLEAYANIEELDEIVKKNGIDVPRLRGYGLMKDEEPDVWDYGDKEIECTKFLCESRPVWNPNASWCECSDYTDYLEDFYLVKEKDEDGFSRYTSVRWDRIHGKKRKILKTMIHNEKKKVEKQRNTWNKYAGRDDVLYIHARIGGNNWPIYSKEVVNQPWFLEKVDDSYDSTYCDIYAKIDLNAGK